MTFKWHFHTFYRCGLVSNGAAPIECQPAPKMWSMNGSRLAPRHTSLAPTMCPCITSNYRNLHQKNLVSSRISLQLTENELVPGLSPLKRAAFWSSTRNRWAPGGLFTKGAKRRRAVALNKPLSSNGGKNQHHAGVNGGSKWSKPGLLQHR